MSIDAKNFKMKINRIGEKYREENIDVKRFATKHGQTLKAMVIKNKSSICYVSMVAVKTCDCGVGPSTATRR